MEEGGVILDEVKRFLFQLTSNRSLLLASEVHTCNERRWLLQPGSEKS